MRHLKNSILLGFAIILFTSCNNKQRYTQQSPEIETVKALIKNYNDKTYDTSMFADTSKTYYNTIDKPMSPSEMVAYHKANDANYSSRGFTDNDPEYEMTVTDKGETWVNLWPNWEGTLAGNGKKVTIPIHLTYRFVNGKIVREVGMWDATPMVLNLQEIEAEKNMPSDEKAIHNTIDQVLLAWNKNDKAAFNSVTVKNFIRNADGKRLASNQDDYGNIMDLYHTGFPDFKVRLDNTDIHGNTVYINWTVTGTNTGKFMDNPPTNKKIDIPGFSVWTFNSDGMAVKEDAFSDNLALYQQLGLPVPKT